MSTTEFRGDREKGQGPCGWKLDGVGPVDNRPSTD